MHNSHIGDDTKYFVAVLEPCEDSQVAGRIRKGRKPQYIPASSDSIERLSCLAGIAVGHLDVALTEMAFNLLKNRFLMATMPAERVLILEAMYHACGYEGSLLMTGMKRQCDKLFDEHIPKELAFYRLLFYRYCPTPLDKSVGRSVGCKQWLKTLKDWMTQLEDSKTGIWEDQPLEVNFLRQRYIYRTGCRYLADSDKQAEYYRNCVYNSFFDCLLKLQKSGSPDVRTLVAAYQALREFKNDVKANEQRYKVFNGKVTSVQSTLPRGSQKWLQLEELKLDYEAHNNDFPFRFVCK